MALVLTEGHLHLRSGAVVVQFGQEIAINHKLPQTLVAPSHPLSLLAF